MRDITFKKQLLGQWRRDDGESKKLVNEESMFREVTKLQHDGWTIRSYGVKLLRMVVAEPPNQAA